MSVKPLVGHLICVGHVHLGVTTDQNRGAQLPYLNNYYTPTSSCAFTHLCSFAGRCLQLE
ncbi:hypothetical protein E2C01_089764 [Portunus trituberculatus]|uniref:Uncharacterized protein n=1 Tax=Portunus trituberculatus TaxID=210409 RepID=A0A5B7JID3_PORTR|nr:hypothetical protein [Portunus trituberculatus]